MLFNTKCFHFFVVLLIYKSKCDVIIILPTWYSSYLASLKIFSFTILEYKWIWNVCLILYDCLCLMLSALPWICGYSQLSTIVVSNICRSFPFLYMYYICCTFWNYLLLIDIVLYPFIRVSHFISFHFDTILTVVQTPFSSAVKVSKPL